MAYRKQTKKLASEEADMDMTPMIDCVFLLMIFFVLVIDLSQQDLEDLILPKAEYSEPDTSPPDIRPIVNINQRGEVIYKKNTYFDPRDPRPEAAKWEAMKRDLLVGEWKQGIPDLETEVVTLGGRTVTLVNDPVLIRADKWTEWHYVGKFMENCSHPEAAFWKLELALSEEDKEEKYFKGRN